MLYMPKTSLSRAVSLLIADGATISAEGRGLVAATVSGVVGVKESTGAAAEVFAGVSVYEKAPLTDLPIIEDLIVGDTVYTVLLGHTPVGGTSNMRVTDAAGTALTPGATTSGSYTLTGTTLTFNADLAGTAVNVSYRYSPTVTEARFIQGDTRAGGTSQAQYGKVGAIKIGDIYTSEFDPTVDWSAANVTIRLGANGKFTIGGSGAIVPAHILQVPSATSPFLGFSLS